MLLSRLDGQSRVLFSALIGSRPPSLHSRLHPNLLYLHQTHRRRTSSHSSLPACSSPQPPAHPRSPVSQVAAEPTAPFASHLSVVRLPLIKVRRQPTPWNVAWASIKTLLGLARHSHVGTAQIEAQRLLQGEKQIKEKKKNHAPHQREGQMCRRAIEAQSTN